MSYDMSILVDNKPIEIYPHESSLFVEGRKGSEYTVRLRNNTGSRALFSLSVDGLSVLDGQEAGNASPGYVLNAWQTLDIACYKVDDNTGAKFTFGSKGSSYSAEVGKGTSNVGVIAALVFKEKPQPVYHYHNYNSFTRGIVAGGISGIGKSGIGDVLSGSIGAKSMPRSPSWNAGNTGGGWSCSTNMAASASSTISANTSTPDTFEQEALGTSFGEAMNWRTITVNFERESDTPNSTLVIFYDSRKNLERRGVQMKKVVPPLPEPFPANKGCPTPNGWRK